MTPMRVLHERPRDSPLLLLLLLSLLLLLPPELEESEEPLVALAAGAGTIGGGVAVAMNRLICTWR